jgi:hypothetical protein
MATVDEATLDTRNSKSRLKPWRLMNAAFYGLVFTAIMTALNITPAPVGNGSEPPGYFLGEITGHWGAGPLLFVALALVRNASVRVTRRLVR